MAIPVTINNTTFQLPTQGTPPAWGDDLSDLILALVNAANAVTGPADILPTSFIIANGQAVAANVIGLSFDPSLVRSAIISYSISRSTGSAETSECGNMYVTYTSSTGTWELAQNYAGLSGVTFTITNGGQVKYTSDTLAGTGYASKMVFSAKSFLQT